MSWAKSEERGDHCRRCIPLRSRRSTSNSSRHSRRRGGRSQVGGIHQRRDKRWPFHPTSDVGGIALDEPPADETAVATAEPEAEPLPAEIEQLDDAPWFKALRLWLEWNVAFEKVTSRMFEGGDNHQRIEDVMDQVDRLRYEAVQLSEDLIS